MLEWLLTTFLAIPPCGLEVSPRVSPNPATLRLRVGVADGSRLARVELVGPNGPVRSSEFPVDAQTTWVEWRDLRVEEGGEYEVQLLTSRGCTARKIVIIAGGG